MLRFGLMLTLDAIFVKIVFHASTQSLDHILPTLSRKSVLRIIKRYLGAQSHYSAYRDPTSVGKSDHIIGHIGVGRLIFSDSSVCVPEFSNILLRQLNDCKAFLITTFFSLGVVNTDRDLSSVEHLCMQDLETDIIDRIGRNVTRNIGTETMVNVV
jgi:hypothetical protein